MLHNHAPLTCLTPKELAKRWRCRPRLIRAMIRVGKLHAILINGRPRITPEAIAAVEAGPMSVRPVRRRRTERPDPEIAAILGSVE